MPFNRFYQGKDGEDYEDGGRKLVEQGTAVGKRACGLADQVKKGFMGPKDEEGIGP